MGQGLSYNSCGELKDTNGNGLSSAIHNGDLEIVKSILQRDPKSIRRLSIGARDRVSPLHIAASSGQIQILSVLLDHGGNPDLFNRHKQTPLMLASMHGKISCLEKLIESGANMLVFDSIQRRTCLHYAALYGQSDCLQALLSAAHSSPVAASWGFARFVNIRDKNGSTPLHLAARQGNVDCVHILLDQGALACALTGGSSGRYCGSTPLHLAARGGSLDCVRELLAHGADRLQRDSAGRNPYMVAIKYKHTACAALLNPSSAAPLVWPSALKFINELNPEAKFLLEKALIEANKKREKSILKEAAHHLLPPLDPSHALEDGSSEESESELCCICFEQACTIQVEECGHQMCAHCTLALCCQNNKPSHHQTSKPPLCPFCRSTITQLVIARMNKYNNDNDDDVINDDRDCDEDDGEVEMSPSKPRRSKKYWSYSEGSSSFKGLSAMGSIGKIVGLGTGKIGAECSSEMDKTTSEDLQ